MPGWVWILLGAVLVLAPLSWLKPSPRHQRLVRLREVARQLGIKVALTPLKLDEQVRIPGVAYRWLRAPDAPPLPGYYCWLKADLPQAAGLTECVPGWRQLNGRDHPLPEAQQLDFWAWVESLPQDVFALEWGSASFVIWWREGQLEVDLAGWDAVVRQWLNQSASR